MSAAVRSTSTTAYALRPRPRGDFSRAPGRGVRLAEQLVILSMCADPEPHKPVTGLDGQCTIASPDPRRPETTNLLEM